MKRRQGKQSRNVGERKTTITEMIRTRKKRIYNRNGWRIKVKEVKKDGGDDLEIEVIGREKDTQRQ